MERYQWNFNGISKAHLKKHLQSVTDKRYKLYCNSDSEREREREREGERERERERGTERGRDRYGDRRERDGERER